MKKIENEIEIPFGAKDSELQEVTYYIPKGFHAEIDDGKVVIKQGELEPAWSEEDENIYARIIRRYTDYEGLIIRTKEKSVANKILDAMTQEETWLKSLKERMKGE